jgi:hypothetical protein
MMALRPGIDSTKEDSSGLALLRATPMSQIVFRETHICPVGELCPPEIILELGGQRRCGICPLACKCVDHLPAIAAKQRQLLDRIQSSREDYVRLSKLGDEISELAEIYDAYEADFQEFLGWRLSEEILEDMRMQLGAQSETLHAAEPEIIRRHLTRVVKMSSQQEFVLRRIVEANVYPTLATDRLRLQALKLKRKVMAGLIDAGSLNGSEDDSHDDIVSLSRFILIVLKSKNLTLEQLSESLTQPLPRRRNSAILLSATGPITGGGGAST